MTGSVLGPSRFRSDLKLQSVAHNLPRDGDCSPRQRAHPLRALLCRPVRWRRPDRCTSQLPDHVTLPRHRPPHPAPPGTEATSAHAARAHQLARAGITQRRNAAVVASRGDRQREMPRVKRRDAGARRGALPHAYHLSAPAGSMCAHPACPPTRQAEDADVAARPLQLVELASVHATFDPGLFEISSDDLSSTEVASSVTAISGRSSATGDGRVSVAPETTPEWRVLSSGVLALRVSGMRWLDQMGRLRCVHGHTASQARPSQASTHRPSERRAPRPHRYTAGPRSGTRGRGFVRAQARLG